MKHEDKELLLKDLCARLPYGVKYECSDIKNIWKLNAILTKRQDDNVFLDIYNPLELCKPYLFPLSSMTDEQRKEYESLCIKETSECTDFYGITFTKDYYYDTIESIDYLYKNHIDVRGLIPKGLANDATGLNIY